MSHFLKTDLQGKVNNLKHFKNEALTPVFETISNSVHAIEERGNVEDGEIIVRIIRIEQESLPGYESTRAQNEIIGFEIEDNGIGFDDPNYDSFMTAETTYKLDKGCKGVGRFFWLKAFEKVEINSVFENEDKYFNRKIEFSLKDGIIEKDCSVTDENQRTIVKLIGFKAQYQKQPSAFKKTKTIAQRIFEHCLVYLIGNVAPKIIVEDREESYSITDMYNHVKDNITTEEIISNDEKIAISHVKLYESYVKMHKIVLTAHNREVKTIDIQKHLGTSKQFDEKGLKFHYCAFISSPYLDDHVDSSRMEFDIPDERNLFTTEDLPLSIQDIKDVILKRASDYLGPYLKLIQEKKIDIIQKYISEKNPALRAVPKYCPEVYDEIEPNSSDEKINEALYIHKGRADYKIKRISEKLLKTQKDSLLEISSDYEKIVDELEDFQKDQLAEYMIYRKMIIDLFEKKIELNKDKKYSNEDIIHDIVFPRKATSEELALEDYNLWLVDERLTFHEFAYSDKPMNQTSSSASKERADVVIFSEIDDDKIARAVSIIEFKKPQRDKYDQDPTAQLYDYVRKIRNESIKLPSGRVLKTNDTTRFYLYGICDITKKIKEFTENNNYARLKGEMGYYLYNRNLNAHVEIIDFDKIIVDVKQRHRIFFEKLGIK